VERVCAAAAWIASFRSYVFGIRSMTPESTTAPVRLIAWKNIRRVDLNEHERLVLVVERRRRRRGPQVAPPQLPARPGDEMRDALSVAQPFVDVVVSREHDVDAVLGQQRFERHAQRHVRTVPAGVGVQRMVEVADFHGSSACCSVLSIHARCRGSS
jgi:hypothetical protein